MKKTHRTVLFTIVFMCIISVLVIGSFYVMTKNKIVSKEEPETEAQILIQKDIKGSYPGTPREVLKLYARITQCLYNDAITDQEYEKLADQLRILFDEELLQANPRETYLKNLKSDIQSYQKNMDKITTYEVALASETDYGTIEEQEYATLKVAFLVQNSEKKITYRKTTEQFLFHQDQEENWKIIHWKQIANENIEDES
ncbi:MAG: hypothetical protein PWP24_1664 [Clostridiales bacterium]|nr:hypothetical protein [Clostridiales bacterium]